MIGLELQTKTTAETHSETLTYYSIDNTKKHYQRSFERFAISNRQPLSEKLILEWIDSERKNKTTGKDKDFKTFEIMLRALRDYLDINADLKDSQRTKLNKTIDQLIKRYTIKSNRQIQREETLSRAEMSELKKYLETKKPTKDRAGNYNPDKYIILSLFIDSLYWSGCRISELVNVKHSDVKIAESGKSVSLRVIGKGKKERSTPILPIEIYQKIVEVTKSNSGNLFKNQIGKPLDRHNVFNEIKKLGREVLGREIYPHIFRHSRATHLYESTKDVKLVQEYLGHSSAKTTLDMYVFMDLKKREGDLLI